MHEKYYILTAELYHPKKLFDEKLYICETLLSHQYLYKNVTPCQAICNKMALDPMPDE